MSTKRKYGQTLSQMQANLDNVLLSDFYFSTLLCADEMMFTYEGLPDTIDEKHIEDYLNLSGSCGIARDKNGTLYAAPYAARTGIANQYGEGTILECCTPNGIDLRGVIGESACIIYNNTARAPQLDLIFDSLTFAEIDKSSKSNVLFSRVAPLFSANDDKSIEGIKAVLENIIAGNLETVLTENIFDEIGMDAKSGIQAIDITHPERIQYLQYLSQFADVVTRRHFARRGLTLKTSAKQAQVSQDEVHGLDSVSWYYPLNKLKARRDGLAICNGIFNTNITVRFSDIWQQEYNAYLVRILQKDMENEKGAENNVESVDDVRESGESTQDNAQSA